MTAGGSTVVDLAQPSTQQLFADIVGVGQPAVSGLIAKGVLSQGAPIGVWLLSCCAHVRGVAAGRDPDGQLAELRTRLAREQADRVAVHNAISRREYMEVRLVDVPLDAGAGMGASSNCTSTSGRPT